MTRQPLRESDLRSLERARMYEIFSPLDTDEPLPRELVLAAKRFRSVGRWELAGAAWLPSLLLILVVGGWVGLSSGLVAAAAVITFLGLLAFAILGGRRSK
jgi:hypothetical protein